MQEVDSFIPYVATMGLALVYFVALYKKTRTSLTGFTWSRVQTLTH